MRPPTFAAVHPMRVGEPHLVGSTSCGVGELAPGTDHVRGAERGAS